MAERKAVGRPRKRERGNPVCTWLSTSEHDQLIAVAKVNRESVSALIRKALRPVLAAVDSITMTHASQICSDSDSADTAYIGIRIPRALNNQLSAIAKRESNGKSAVCRRLLSRALATDN